MFLKSNYKFLKKTNANSFLLNYSTPLYIYSCNFKIKKKKQCLIFFNTLLQCNNKFDKFSLDLENKKIIKKLNNFLDNIFLFKKSKTLEIICYNSFYNVLNILKSVRFFKRYPVNGQSNRRVKHFYKKKHNYIRDYLSYKKNIIKIFSKCDLNFFNLNFFNDYVSDYHNLIYNNNLKFNIKKKI